MTAAGFVAVGPRGGFTDTTLSHFLQLRCETCGESTHKDVCLFAPAPDMASCTDWHGAGRVMVTCYPKCANDSHLVRKCACHSVGSVEITVEEDCGSPMLLESIGYSPVAYTPGPGWAATTTAGETIPVAYNADDKTFRCFRQESGAHVVVAVVDFKFVKECL